MELVLPEEKVINSEEEIWNELEAIFGSLEEEGRPERAEGGVPDEGTSFPSQE